MRVLRICANAFREAEDRRRIDNFGFDFPGQVLDGTRDRDCSRVAVMSAKCDEIEMKGDVLHDC